MKTTIFIITGFFVMVTGWAVSAREVPINPITHDIRAQLRESTELIGSVENSMAPKVAELEKIYKTYTESCKGKEKDRGCVEMQNQVREKYKAILQTMSNELPKVRASVSRTGQELGKSIKTKTHTKNLRSLLMEVSQKGTLPKIRGPLSKKLSELLKAMGRPTTNVSILELSLRTQADLISATELLDFLDAEISRQLVVVDMMQDFGALSPEMASVMKGVGEIFGYEADFGTPVVDEVATVSDDWRN